MASSWPWMKGVQEAIADPIPPVDKHDKRPAVKDLIAAHRVKIDKVRSDLKQDPLYEATKHDDLWILRFLMSHKGSTQKALKAAQGCMLFRKEHSIGTDDIRPFGLSKDGCKSGALKRYLTYAKPDFAMGAVPDGRYGAIIFLTFASLDQHGLIGNVDESDWLPTFAYVNEWSFQWCDYVTRTTGRLTKLIRLVDTNGVSMSQFNQDVSKRDTGAMNAMEDFYPQLLQTIFVCNAPAWVQVPWRILRPLLPTRIIEKFDFINPEDNEKERKRLASYISEENLPERFGGGYKPWPVDYHLPTSNIVTNEISC